MIKLQLWKVLVPTAKPNGGFFSIRHHREWDRKVVKMVGGATVLGPVKGKWRSGAGELLQERIIPVLVACARPQLDEVLAMTKAHYSQEVVVAYLVSEDVVFV